MKHFLLTRFNLILWPRNKFGVKFDREMWLSQRMDLFEKFCIPSIASQTCKDFEWILLMDENTPDWCRERIKKIKCAVPQVTTVFVPRSRNIQFASVFCEEVRKRLDGEHKIITTYLDNDDAISVDFIEEVQKLAMKADINTIISFTRGYQYFSDIKFAMEVLYPNNHFISLVESAESCRTVYGYGSHIAIGRLKCLKLLKIDKTKWAEVIHSQNVDNDVKMTVHTRLCKDGNRLVEFYGPAFELAPDYFQKIMTAWLPMALRHMAIRVKQRIMGRNWW